MKYRFFLVLLCMTFVACTGGERAQQPDDRESSESVAQKTDPPESSAPETEAPKEMTSEAVTLETRASETKASESLASETEESHTGAPESLASEPILENARPDSSADSENGATLTPSEQYNAIVQRYDEQMASYQAVFRKASADDRRKIYDELFPNPVDYVDDFMELADDHPESEAAVDALVWVAKQMRPDTAEAADLALRRLMSQHADSDKLVEICRTMPFRQPNARIPEDLEKLIQESPHDEVKAAATYGLAEFYKRLPRTAQYIKQNPNRHSYDEFAAAFVESFEPDEEKVIALYESLLENYSDYRVSERSSRTYGTVAEGALFEMKNLQIGMVAPDIEGSDLDGVEFKLSDYRGKVVVIDFWGDW